MKQHESNNARDALDRATIDAELRALGEPELALDAEIRCLTGDHAGDVDRMLVTRLFAAAYVEPVLHGDRVWAQIERRHAARRHAARAPVIATRSSGRNMMAIVAAAAVVTLWLRTQDVRAIDGETRSDLAEISRAAHALLPAVLPTLQEDELPGAGRTRAWAQAYHPQHAAPAAMRTRPRDGVGPKGVP